MEGVILILKRTNKNNLSAIIISILFAIALFAISKITVSNNEYLHNKQSGRVVTTTYSQIEQKTDMARTIEIALCEEATTYARIGIAKTILTATNNIPTVDDILKIDNINSVVQENVIQDTPDPIYAGTFEATWYCATDMEYTTAPYGSSGRTLETAYSVASNYFPQGTLLYIEGGGLSGTYRVDDTGAMATNVIDFYYWDRSHVPADFLTAGRIKIQVYIIE